MKKWLLIIVLILVMAGCQAIQEHAERELLDNAKTLNIARLRMPVVKSHIAFVNGLGRAEELPVKAVSAMDEYLVLATEPNSLSDYELAYSLGLSVQIYESWIKYAIELQRLWP